MAREFTVETFAGDTLTPELIAREVVQLTEGQSAGLAQSELDADDRRVVQAMEEFLALQAPDILERHGVDRAEREAKRAEIRSAREKKDS